FISSADELFRPMTTIRRDGFTIKHIKWSAFAFSKADWKSLDNMRKILQDSHNIQQAFSAEKQLTLWRTIPALEDLMSSWEDKLNDDAFADYHNALQDGITKIRKYYCCFDEKPNFILSLFLHPYYGSEYIRMAWGGEEEWIEEVANGNLDAKNWQDEAMKVLEKAVSANPIVSFHLD
ncbi:hypothetical protein JOM56_002289, partial [Amanita muscaria]